MNRFAWILFGAVLVIPVGVYAHSGATGIVKERMELMKSIAAQMKIVGDMVKGTRPYDADDVADAADLIAEHAANMVEKFPKGSTEHPSEALPLIWEDWDRFQTLSVELKTAANAMAERARDATEISSIGEEFTAVGKTCSACHEDFRKAQ